MPNNPDTLALIFAGLMGFSMLMYAILDGYDLGVGILSAKATSSEKDKMIASIGPFWDANETWLVLGVGLLLVAFPKAHGIILTNLYLPVALMLTSLILRGVAFEFRMKAKDHHKDAWNVVFFGGSIFTSFSQGAMLGFYILGFDTSLSAIAFSILVGFCIIAGYSLIGATWLIIKTDGDLQKKAIIWTQKSLLGTVLGIIVISITTPLVSARIFERWFSVPNFFFLALIPIVTGILVLFLRHKVSHFSVLQNKSHSTPFFLTIGIFALCFSGLAYSFYPYIVPEHLKITDAASSPESLKIILIGTLIILPLLVAYTSASYYIFRGKTTDLSYD